jgi:hypothetical protein
MTDNYLVPLVPLVDIESEAGWRLSRAGVELNGAVRPDWAGRPSVPASVAAKLYERLVEERTLLAAEQERELNRRAEEEAARRAAERASRERWVELHGDVLAGFAQKGLAEGR